MGGLSGTLQAAHHYDAGRLLRELYPCAVVAHESDKLVVYYLYHLLCRGKARKYFLAYASFSDLSHEVLNDLVAYIGFKKRHLYLAHCRFDIVLGQLAAGTQLFEYAAKLFR